MAQSDHTKRVLRHILGTLGLGSALGAAAATEQGCSATVQLEPSGASGSTAASTTGAGPLFFDGGPDAMTPASCAGPLFPEPIEVPSGVACDIDAGYFLQQLSCFVVPDGPAGCSAYTSECILDTFRCGHADQGDAYCGPFEEVAGACCYLVFGGCPVGRPFMIDGEARLAALATGEGWAEPLAPDMSQLAPATRAALADFWGKEALFEHASIASFARFVLELLSVGAPAYLVRDAQRALAEEGDHARVSFGLASAYAGGTLGPTRLPIDGALRGSTTLTSMAVTTAAEGCVAETVSALLLLAARDAATDPVVQRELGRIADQEVEHAALAWRTVAWALDRGGEPLRRAVEAVFANAHGHVGLGATTQIAGDEQQMRAHGYVPPRERAAIARQALASVVLPAAQRLVSPADRAEAVQPTAAQRL
jgi:hypothetical protein